ncbi:DNA/RNA non-specific endonuclease [Acinetobacter radioresistens]|uniref:DNA/RNA non-specific endonuclease n=1 Tax=Acinetobacter radioresistens TaxID=40216 RepID=UPI000D021996|nr:DNA/RNA non-specific endonuclease [Acinetobacter radioresistens]MCU4515700.1 DNA/RNA non-specific endonuclease [Acinetobacter radioresistens]RSO70776.1 DNA/RNA non-specific endonuclease [Acinetobacter radioresistens]
MATRKTRSKSRSKTPFLNSRLSKGLLGVLAAGSFAIAFGEEKIGQLFTAGTSNAACLNQFYREVPPYLVKESLKKDSYPLCFNGFNVMYSGVSKTPLWVAEYLNPQRLSTKIKREDNFHEESRVAERHRALLSDYRGSGYDRGHMAPNGDMNNTAAQYDSFSLANMVPQSPKNNQELWRKLEEAVRAIVTKQHRDAYVVTGPVFEGKRLKTIGQGVIVPTAVYKAVYLPKQGISGAYYAPNNDSQQVKVVSICYLEEKLGINLFPQLTEQQKRNIYQLPLTAAQVKANQDIKYMRWDAESQCAEEADTASIQAQQKQFASGQPQTAESKLPQIDEETKQALIKQLVDMLVQYFLQLLR